MQKDDEDNIIFLCLNLDMVCEDSSTIFCKMSKNFDNMKVLFKLPSPPKYLQSYLNVVQYGKYKIFIPSNNDQIYLYDGVSFTYERLNVPKERRGVFTFFSYKLINDKLYLFTFLPFIYVLDLSDLNKTGKISKKVKIISVNDSLSKNSVEYMFWGTDIEILNQKLYATVKPLNVLVEFDLKSYKYKIIEIPFATAILKSYNENLLLLDEKKGILYTYDILKKELSFLYSNKFLISQKDCCFIKSLILENYLYLWQNLSDDLIILNLTNGFVTSFFMGEPYNKHYFTPPVPFYKIGDCKIIDNKIIFHSVARNEFFCFTQDQLLWRKEAVTEKMAQEINFHHALMNNETLREVKAYDLNCYLENLNILKPSIPKNNTNVGKQIYKTIIKKM